MIAGAALATWTARIPAIKQRLGLDEAALSVALMAVAAGSVLAMQAVGPLTDRFGSTRVVPPAGVLMSLSMSLAGFAGNLPTLIIGLLVFGAGHGMLDVSMNTHAVGVERRYGRPIMSTFHATFSFGGLLGSGVGALAAYLALGPGANFTIVGIALALISLAARPALLPAEPARRGESSAPASPRGIPLGIVFLGALGFCCSLGEGSMNDWSSVYLRDALGTSPAVAAIGFAVFSATMTAFRLLGDRLSAWFGPVVLVRGCGAVAGLGLGGALLLHHPAAALVGYGLFGAGLSCIVPQVFSAAGNRDPGRSGRDLAQVSTLAYSGLLAGPVVIGFTAHWVGLGAALGIPAVLALFIAVSAPALRSRPPRV